MSDNELAQLAAKGDAAAFGTLVRNHQSRLRGFLLRLTRGNAALADDLAQDAFFEAWRKIAQFRGEGSFGAWLARIAYSRYLMEARRRKLEPLDGNSEECEPIAVEADMRMDLEKALATISLAQRAALTLCYALGHSHEEAAAILDMPVGTVKSLILRGRKKVQAILAGAS